MSANDIGDEDSPPEPLPAFGEYVRAQRQLARLTLRELAKLTSVSNPYLSQIERGMHQPSIIVVKALAEALNLSAETLLSQAAGLTDSSRSSRDVETEVAIRADPRLAPAQKAALLAVYDSMVGGTPARQTRSAGETRG
jgi:transcriptional regulator with XRE-family HTH domain